MEERCKSCRYRSGTPRDNGCDYLLLTGKARGCPAGEGCRRYEAGPRLAWREQEPPAKISPEDRLLDDYLSSVARRLKAAKNSKKTEK